MKRLPECLATFDFYDCERGKPWLALFQYRTGRAHVRWSDGTMTLYPYFERAVNGPAMNTALRALWKASLPRVNSRSYLCCGSTGGCLTYVPLEVAEQAYDLVDRHFSAGLQRLQDIAKSLNTDGPGLGLLDGWVHLLSESPGRLTGEIPGP